MCFQNSEFWIKFNSTIVTIVSLIFLGISILNFWMGDHESVTLLMLVVTVSFAFGFQIYYLCGSLREARRIDTEWNMRHMFYPFILFYWYSVICGINFIKVLTVKYKIEIWKDIFKEDLWDINNAMMITLIASLFVLGIVTWCSTNIHYRNSYGYQKYIQDRCIVNDSHKNPHRTNTPSAPPLNTLQDYSSVLYGNLQNLNSQHYE